MPKSNRLDKPRWKMCVDHLASGGQRLPASLGLLGQEGIGSRGGALHGAESSQREMPKGKPNCSQIGASA